MADGQNPLDSNFLITVFNNSTNHITFMKKQQWTITYYCLLIYAAVITF